MTQSVDLREAKVRTYQTAILFRSSFAKKGLRLLTFLGIGVPIVAGVIVTSLYADKKPPVELVAIAGLVGGAQVLGSLWALVYDWDGKARRAEQYAKEADDLLIELNTFTPDPTTGMYDPTRLQEFVKRSYNGLHADRIQEISQRKRDKAKAIAESRIPK